MSNRIMKSQANKRQLGAHINSTNYQVKPGVFIPSKQMVFGDN